MASLTSLRADAREIFAAGVKSADPFAAVTRIVQLQNDRLRVGERSYDLSAIRNIFIAGCGKGAAPMALALQTLLGEEICGGVIVVKYGHQLQLENIEVMEAGHPIPDKASLRAAREVMGLAARCVQGDTIFFVVTGGGSALLSCPAEGLSLEDKQRTTEALLKSGATIAEVNAVRKHISRIKGGRLAQLAAPARVVSLILSDVVDDTLDAIASGPTVPDSSTYADCAEIMQRYDLRHRVPAAVVKFLDHGAKGEVAETPKASDSIFENVQNIIVGSNRLALTAARQRAEALGYHAWVVSDSMQGESRAVARSYCVLVKEIMRTNKPISRPACLLSGGETTVTVRGDGLGGRNQEFALAAAIESDGLDGVVILSGGTDGTDGPTAAAGGIIDGSTVQRGIARNLDPQTFLDRNDSYHFLLATDDLLLTGPTWTNVMDLQITLIA